MFASKRLGKELQKAKQKLPPGIDIVKADDFREWQMDIRVLDGNPLYKDVYRLSFIFNGSYPIEPPEVSFITVPTSSYMSPATVTPTPPPQTPQTQQQTQPQTQPQTIDLTSDDPPPATTTPNLTSPNRPIPIHPHIYSNGIICLDLLGSAGWSPVQSVESVCMSIQSMLTGNTKNVRPEGDEQFCRSMGVRGKEGWSGSNGRGSGGGGWGRGGLGGGRGLKDVRFAYDDESV